MQVMTIDDTKSFSRDACRLEGIRSRKELSLCDSAPPARPLRPLLPRLRMCTFEPRPYPPPALRNIPEAYIQVQLRRLAQHYWSKPDTADCTIIVPYYHAHRSTPSPTTTQGPFPGGALPRAASDPAGLGRRATEPTLLPSVTRRLVMKLHVDYLSAHSTFLRGLFSGSSPLGLITPSGVASWPSKYPPPASHPRLLESKANHPTIYLPVPDPSSLGLLIHWCYFGETDFLEDRLLRGLVSWEGVARNVEYLGLGKEIKAFLGDYHRRHVAQQWPWGSRPTTPVLDDDHDSDVDAANVWSPIDEITVDLADVAMDDSPSSPDFEDTELERGRPTAARNIGRSLR